MPDSNSEQTSFERRRSPRFTMAKSSPKEMSAKPKPSTPESTSQKMSPTQQSKYNDTAEFYLLLCN